MYGTNREYRQYLAAITTTTNISNDRNERGIPAGYWLYFFLFTYEFLISEGVHPCTDRISFLFSVERTEVDYQTVTNDQQLHLTRPCSSRIAYLLPVECTELIIFAVWSWEHHICMTYFHRHLIAISCFPLHSLRLHIEQDELAPGDLSDILFRT